MSRSPRQPRPRRQRGARESLLSVILGFESIVAFLAGLSVYGLRALPQGIEPWWGIVGGVTLGILMIVVSAFTRYRAGVIAGGLLQVVVALGAFLVPAVLIAAAVFGALYVYGTIKGGALDERNATLAAEAEKNGD
ncbi:MULTISPECIES: DUF4233 domain-containing protein [Microbacterium]|uniref:DUF4233 domain-containing protein n=1 Tax=Microbacterium aquilitoris TaxID=3067307 RepID=A0ABU3GLA7_9MICO|nr:MULTISPECIES: DUF4233 domain-containing protein [unclassified Microbacterium]MDT3331496.1 DUF4233 domain-containing protein [Microbacterium sp. KSW-18]MDT3343734.1 DUF4233 domain-containing protein [Microbacterium sp. KSW2-22]